jgi:drug/metabolite transporter (DMT)-like permease
MVYTTSGKGGFITALYIVIVPILGLFLGKKIRPLIVFCVALAVTGLYLLTVKEGLSINKGDLMILACAFFFSFHILVIDHYSPTTNSVGISAIQLLITSILSLPCMLIFETVNWSAVWDCAFPIFYAGVMSCGIAYTLQIVGQKYAEPTVASLLMSLESVFAAVAGAVVLGEVLTGRELAGCIIMFVAIVLAQLPERKKRKG